MIVLVSNGMPRRIQFSNSSYDRFVDGILCIALQYLFRARVGSAENAEAASIAHPLQVVEPDVVRANRAAPLKAGIVLREVSDELVEIAASVGKVVVKEVELGNAVVAVEVP